MSYNYPTAKDSSHNEISQLGSAMQNMNAGTADFTRLAKNITKIGSVDSVALTNR